MLELVKKVLRISTTVYDDELTMLIAAALKDLIMAGVIIDQDNAAVKRAICTYCRAHFGSPDDYQNLKADYDEQKAQLMTSSGTTDWGDDDE